MIKVLFVIKLIVISLLLQACSGSGFHLRKNIELPTQYKAVYLQGLPNETGFKSFFIDALLEAGGLNTESIKQAKTVIKFIEFKEGRRVIAYNSDRRAREYLVFLKLHYRIDQLSPSIEIKTSLNEKGDTGVVHRINIDRSYLYDSDFALGKAEEERQVKKALYEEAARLILLRLKYAHQ